MISTESVGSVQDGSPAGGGLSLRILTGILLLAVAGVAVAVAYYVALQGERAGYSALSRSEVDRVEARLGLAEAAVRALMQQADAYLQLKDSLQAQNSRLLLAGAADAVRGLRDIARAESTRTICDGILLSLDAVGADLQPLRTNEELARVDSQVASLDRDLQMLAVRMGELERNLVRERDAVGDFYRERIAASRATALALIPAALALALGGGILFYRMVLAPLDQLGRATESAVGRGEPFRIDLRAPGVREIRHAREGASRLFLQLDGLVRERTARLQEALRVSDERNVQLTAAERQVRRSREQFSEVFESAPSALVLAGPDGGVVLVNRAAERILDLPRGVMFGRPVGDLIREAGLLAEAGELGDFLSRRERGRALRLHRAGTAEFFGELEVRAFGTDAEDGTLIQINDTTQREQRLRGEQRSQRLESIGTLAGGIAHDLNNTLAPISMSIEKLRLAYPGETSLLKTLESCCRRGAGMVRQLLTFAKGSPGDLQPVDCRLLIDEIASMIRATFPRDIILRLSFEEGAPAVNGDVTQLFQALLNLCVNSRDAKAGGGRLDISLRSVPAPVDASVGGRWIEIAVADTGCGMSKEVMMRIFDPFFTTKSADKGSGLGLSTTLGIIRGHGGRIDVESFPGRGTTFRVLFPAVEASALQAGSSSDSASPSGSGRRVLVVDDEVAVREVLSLLLDSAGFRVVTAADGAEALRRLGEEGVVYDLVITDILMRELDGAGLIRGMREADLRVPVVVIGAAITPGQKKELLAEGAVAVISKPFSQAEIFAVVRETIMAADAGS